MYDELKKLAKASAGEWYGIGELRYEDRLTGDLHGLHHNDERFIAAANPSAVLALIGRLEVSESMEGLYTSTVTVERAELEQTKRERDQLKAENELLRHQLAACAQELRKASSWICREVEAGTESATHWAIRLRANADQIDSAISADPVK